MVLVFGFMSLILALVCSQGLCVATGLSKYDPEYAYTLEGSEGRSPIWLAAAALTMVGICSYTSGLFGWFLVGAALPVVAIGYAALTKRD